MVTPDVQVENRSPYYVVDFKQREVLVPNVNFANFVSIDRGGLIFGRTSSAEQSMNEFII